MTQFVSNNVSSGSIIYASDHNEMGSRIAAVVNGGLDDTNISAVSGTKISAGTLPGTALDAATAGGWLTPSVTFTYNANNGNKEFVLTPSADPTGFLSPGMKFKHTRHTVPPTQCMAFTAASSQYATKASPTGITFTGAFTCEAWVYLNSYTGSTVGVIGRYDTGTSSGFGLRINGSGQVDIFYAASSSFTEWASYQSIPLNRWVHIAAVVSSVSSKTLQGIYINGVSVPTSSVASATATLTQAGNLSVGAQGAAVASSYINGYISEARVWSVAQSQASIQANMAISIAAQANLVVAIPGAGNFNDISGNGNNLTATNGAIATQAANPFNATEYGIIRAVSATSVTVFTDDYGAIPNDTLDSPAYSTQKEPFGWPAHLISDKIWGTVLWCANQTTTATATGTQLGGATLTVTVPTGGKRFILKFYGGLAAGAGVGVIDLYAGTTQIVRGQTVSTALGDLMIASQPVVLSAGSQTVSADIWESSAGTCTFSASPTVPAWFSLEEA